jgi:hypothetical protein
MSLSDRRTICVCVSIPVYQLLIALNRLYENWFMFYNTWAHLNGYFTNPSLQSVCLYMYVTHIVARQRLGKNVTAAMNIFFS